MFTITCTACGYTGEFGEFIQAVSASQTYGVEVHAVVLEICCPKCNQWLPLEIE